MNQNQQTSKGYVVVANVIKFGVPLGILLSLGRVIGRLIFSSGPIDSDFIVTTCSLFIMGILFGAVLGLIRKG